MKPLILAVLVAISQATPPVPLKVADNDTPASQNLKDKGNAKYHPADQPQSTVNGEIKAKAPDGCTGKQGQNDTEHTIAVSKLPPVTVNGPKRDLADWGYWAFGGLLVVVGFLQVWLLRRQASIMAQQKKLSQDTLGAIQRQAGIMEAQTTVLKDSVEAVKNQANIMERQTVATEKAAEAAKTSAEVARRSLILMYRPRLLIRPIEVDGFDKRRIGARLINGRVFVTNIGVLPVTIQKFWANWYFWDTMPLDNPAHKLDQGEAFDECLPGRYVTFRLPDYDVPVDVFIKINNYAEIAERGLAGSSGSLTQAPSGKLYLIGCVKYRDEIGLRRQYFAYSWEPIHGRFKAVKHPTYSYEK